MHTTARSQRALEQQHALTALDAARRTTRRLCVAPGHSAAYPSCTADVAAMTPGTAGATSGNTAACRAYHLSVAQATDPAVHCPHASADGGGVCVSAGFCSDYQTTCVATGLSAPYSNCAANIAAMSAGTAGATSGDTAACRAYHLGVAKTTDPAVHCPHASPNGGGVCSAPPSAFCTDYQTTCVATGLGAAYPDCAANIGAMAAGTPGDVGGDTSACREYHLSVAKTTDPAVHCPHASLSGGGVCVAPPFCPTYQSTCVATGLSAAYGNCVSDIAALAPGVTGDVSGNTAACRAYHLSVATATDPAVHCPHASSSGGGVCVDPQFCTDYQTTCVATGLSPAYPSCAANIAAMSAGTSGDTGGDTAACREYHLG